MKCVIVRKQVLGFVGDYLEASNAVADDVKDESGGWG